MANGSIILDALGRRVRDSDGKYLIDDGTGSCCAKQARKCSDGSLAGLWLQKSLFPNPAVDYFVKRTSDSTCYEFLAADSFYPMCSTQTQIGAVTAVTGCSDAACGGGCDTSAGSSGFDNPCPALPTSYLINEYASLTIGTCPLCNVTSAAAAWDGTVSKSGVNCGWLSAAGVGGGFVSFAGLLLLAQLRPSFTGSTGSGSTASGCNDAGQPAGQWVIIISCSNKPPGAPFGSLYVIWEGCNPCKNPAIGVFTRYSGMCAGPLTMSLS